MSAELEAELARLRAEHERLRIDRDEWWEAVTDKRPAGPASEAIFKMGAACDRWREEVARLREALSVAADDLDKAANQFAGLVRDGRNEGIFAAKAVRARRALEASFDPPDPPDPRPTDARVVNAHVVLAALLHTAVASDPKSNPPGFHHAAELGLVQARGGLRVTALGRGVLRALGLDIL